MGEIKENGLEHPVKQALAIAATPARPAVVLIDQLDALSMCLGADRGMLTSYTELLGDLQGISHVRFVISCRTFDLQHDPELAPFRKAERVEVGELSREQVDEALQAADAGTSPGAPAAVGVNTGSLDLSATAGNATAYGITLERYDAGTFTAVGYLVTGDLSAGAFPTALPLSTLADQAGLTAGYFQPGGNGFGIVHRLTVEVSNRCGAAPSLAGYFVANDFACRSVPPKDRPYTLYPNPAADEVLIQPVGSSGAGAPAPAAASGGIETVRVYDSYGKLRLEQSGKQAAAVHLVVTQLPAGLYTVHLLRGGEVVDRQKLQVAR